MLYFMLLVSAIILIDLSNSHLNIDLMSLIYSADLGKQAEDKISEDLTVEQIAQQVEGFIYNGGNDEEEVK